MNERYLLLTENALDVVLMHRLFDQGGLPVMHEERGLVSRSFGSLLAIATTTEPTAPYLALVQLDPLRTLLQEAAPSFGDVYGRVARVVKALKSPPIHLPRHWSEFHYKNLITFFALQRSSQSYRWIVDSDNALRCARFDVLTTSGEQVELSAHRPSAWPIELGQVEPWWNELRTSKSTKPATHGLADEVDLQVIGSSSVVRAKTFEAWEELLTDDQKSVLRAPITHSVRIIGPAGSGKTLALCMKALQVARTADESGQAKKVLVVAHSWAMAERVDGVLETLSGGQIPGSVTILPLLYLLQIHAGQGAGQRIDVIGDDSKGGRVAAIELIQEVVAEESARERSSGGDVSQWLVAALSARADSRAKTDLALVLYDEFTGVLAAEGLAIDDSESIKRYFGAAREDWMPPFTTVGDRRIVIQLYKRFLTKLSDRGAITTDQFVSDSIRVLETFAWRTRRESDGYDFIFVDELQLFDSQERLALELLGRSRAGVPFVTAEDPSQGVFAPLHKRQASGGVNTSVYLDAVHRFDTAIFNLIRFIYQKFPLNTIPLRIDPKKKASGVLPTLHVCDDDAAAISRAASLASEAAKTLDGAKRVCVITIGDVDEALVRELAVPGVPVVQLQSFDDVEKLSYTKRTVIIAPWQFVGGTQFSNVIVLAAGTQAASTSFGRLRELTSIYLSCSRAAERLDMVCGVHIPKVLEDAAAARIVSEVH